MKRPSRSAATSLLYLNVSDKSRNNSADGELVRSILEEYTNNIMDGMSIDGEFFIATHRETYLIDISKRLKKIGWMCSDTTTTGSSPGWCTTRYQPYDEWFEHSANYNI